MDDTNIIYNKDDSYTKESESVSIGNGLLYGLCERYPLGNDVNAMISKIWLIGRSYAASPERRDYSKNYKVNDDKIDLNIGNARDSFFNKLSKQIIQDKNYNELKTLVDETKANNYIYDYQVDKQLLEKTVYVVLLFNRIVRRCIEIIDEPALENYERKHNGKKENRKLRYFISFCSKFMHFHLPKSVFIIDSISFEHAKKKRNRKKDSDYIFVDSDGQEVLSIEKNYIKYDLNIKLENIVDKEKQYIDHVSRSYFIMCKLKEKYQNNITPRMLDNFIMEVNYSKNNISEID